LIRIKISVKYFWCCLILFPIGIFSQVNAHNSFIDSLKLQLVKDSTFIYRTTNIKPYLRLESRNSFINKQPVRLFGFLVGATFVEKHVLSAGFYFLDKRKESPLSILDGRYNVNHFFALNYFDFSYQYILFNTKYFQSFVPIEFGYGKFKITSNNATSTFSDFSGDFIPISAGVQLIVKPIKWLGISGMAGYRYVKQEQAALNLRGFYYSAGVWVDIRQIYRNYKFQKKKKEFVRKIEGQTRLH
jgi:hypothetical protein